MVRVNPFVWSSSLVLNPVFGHSDVLSLLAYVFHLALLAPALIVLIAEVTSSNFDFSVLCQMFGSSSFAFLS